MRKDIKDAIRERLKLLNLHCDYRMSDIAEILANNYVRTHHKPGDRYPCTDSNMHLRGAIDYLASAIYKCTDDRINITKFQQGVRERTLKKIREILKEGADKKE